MMLTSICEGIGKLSPLAIAIWLAGCDVPARPTDWYLNQEFWGLDCDGNGRLSYHELVNFRWKRALEGIERPLLEAEFSGADADGDLALTIEEYARLANADGQYHYSPHPNCGGGLTPRPAE